MLDKVIEAITAQQPKLRNDVWMVGEQLKDLLRSEPQWAEMVLQDLKNKEQNLEAIAKKIRERAQKNKTGSFGCVTPAEAEEIIRKTFCIPDNEKEKPAPSNVISLEDFF
jgi:protein involved in temperature-dependent protein secretion